MISSIASLPDNSEDLKKIIAERDQYYQVYIKCLEEKISLLEGKLFGRKSEKISTGKYLQTLLFDEVEDTVDKSLTDEDNDKIIVPAHKRKKPGRKPLPEDLPRVEKIHDLPEEEKMCGCGAKMERIATDVPWAYILAVAENLDEDRNEHHRSDRVGRNERACRANIVCPDTPPARLTSSRMA